MKNTTPLIESILPVRHRLAADETGTAYNVACQTAGYSSDRRYLPNEIHASDGGSDSIKLIDKGPEDCWVAREVYGAENPRWMMFREWLLSDAPAWFRDLYISQGETFAAWVSDKPVLKSVIRRWMDARIRGRAVRVACRCEMARS